MVPGMAELVVDLLTAQALRDGRCGGRRAATFLAFQTELAEWTGAIGDIGHGAGRDSLAQRAGGDDGCC